MIARRLRSRLLALLDKYPAVVLLGPRSWRRGRRRGFL